MTTPSIPRALERYPLGEQLEGERWNATDRDRGRDVTVTRVAFGRDRAAERDAFVERARALYAVNDPALIAIYDAGAWDDDAFVVEERVIEPQPLGSMELDAREKALAARAIATGVATLNAASWSLTSIDAVMDAYRQPKIALVQHAERATDASRARDLREVTEVVQRLAPDTRTAATLPDLAAAIAAPEMSATPLVHASPPKRSPLLWAVLALGVALVFLLFTRL